MPNWKQEILAKIKPTRQEEKEIAPQVSNFLKEINTFLGDARAILGGSGAKGTWLRGQHDADVFIAFPYNKYKDKSSQLSDLLEAAIKQAGKPYKRLHGSRDYFQIRENDTTFELIPIIEITHARDALNITDVSPLHAEWVKKHSTEKLRDDIRLAKAFCKAQRCYGAESYIRGLSGYVLELLIIQTGGFEKLLRQSMKWKNKQVIDVAKLYKKGSAWMSLNKAKLESPIIVIDPVDKSRNAAAALSKETWDAFGKRAAKFLKSPSAAFFEVGHVTLNELTRKKRKHVLVWIDTDSTHDKEDVAGTKLLQAFEFIKARLGPFVVMKSGWEWDRKQHAIFWYLLKKKSLPSTELRKGPPLDLTYHVQSFREEHKRVFVRNGHAWAYIPVEHSKIEERIGHVTKNPFVTSRVQEVGRVVIEE